MSRIYDRIFFYNVYDLTSIEPNSILIIYIFMYHFLEVTVIMGYFLRVCITSSVNNLVNKLKELYTST